MNEFMEDENYQSETYLDYIEKHVILDLMLEPVINRYFVNYKSFPYRGKDLLGN